MNQTGTLALSCGLLCVWPLFFGFLCYNIGARRIRLRNPIVVGENGERSEQSSGRRWLARRRDDGLYTNK